MAGRKYIVYADRFSGWTEVASTHPDSKATTICNILRRYFISFGVPEQITSDGGPPFDSHDVSTFLKTWGVTHRFSSAYYPQSNGRAEAAVKYMKRILTTNISPTGSLDTNAVAKALLLHRNTPPPDIGASPAELLFGRPINDHLPSPVKFRKEWLEIANMREKAINHRYTHATKTNPTTFPLTNIQPGDPVAVQNQHGNHPLRWQNTGTVVTALPHRQYRILVDGSRRTTLRNRRFIRKIEHETRDRSYGVSQTIPPIHTSHPIPTNSSYQVPMPPTPPHTLFETPMNDAPPLQTNPVVPSNDQTVIEHNDTDLIQRRPTRVRRMPSRYSDYVMGHIK
jgi:hypothetical protein